MTEQQPQHKCSSKCHHTCGEAGGVTKIGTPCKRAGYYGVIGKRAGSLGLCADHTPLTTRKPRRQSTKPPMPPMQKLPKGKRTLPKRPRAPWDRGDVPAAVRATMVELTPMRQRFVHEYCGRARGNGALAAKLLGVGKPGQEAQAGRQILLDKKVRRAIEAWTLAYAMTAADVTAAIADLTECNMGPFVSVNPANDSLVLDLTEEEWNRHKHWVKKVDVDPETGQITKLELHDRHAALKDMARILKVVDAPVTNNFYYGTLSDDQLLERMAAIARGLTPRRVQKPVSFLNAGDGQEIEDAKVVVTTEKSSAGNGKRTNGRRNGKGGGT